MHPLCASICQRQTFPEQHSGLINRTLADVQPAGIHGGVWLNEQINGDEAEQLQLFHWQETRWTFKPTTNSSYTHTHTYRHVLEKMH